MIDLQNGNGHAPDWGQRNDLRAFQVKVQIPVLRARIVERSQSQPDAVLPTRASWMGCQLLISVRFRQSDDVFQEQIAL